MTEAGEGELCADGALERRVPAHVFHTFPPHPASTPPLGSFPGKTLLVLCNQLGRPSTALHTELPCFGWSWSLQLDTGLCIWAGQALPTVMRDQGKEGTFYGQGAATRSRRLP